MQKTNDQISQNSLSNSQSKPAILIKSFDDYRQIIMQLKLKIKRIQESNKQLQQQILDIKQQKLTNAQNLVKLFVAEKIIKIQALIKGFIVRKKLEDRKFAPIEMQKSKKEQKLDVENLTYEQCIYKLSQAIKQRAGLNMEMVFRMLCKSEQEQINTEDFNQFVQNLSLTKHGISHTQILKALLVFNEEYKPFISKRDYFYCLFAYNIVEERQSNAIIQQLFQSDANFMKFKQNVKDIEKYNSLTYAQRILLKFASVIHDKRYSILQAFNEIRMISNKNEIFVTKLNLKNFLIKKFQEILSEKELFALMSIFNHYNVNRKSKTIQLNYKDNFSEDNIFLSDKIKITKETFILSIQKAYQMLNFQFQEIDGQFIVNLQKQGLASAQKQILDEEYNFEQNQVLLQVKSMQNFYQTENLSKQSKIPESNTISDRVILTLEYSFDSKEKEQMIVTKFGEQYITEEMRTIRDKIQKSGRPFYQCLEQLLLTSNLPVNEGFTIRQVTQTIQECYKDILNQNEISYLLKQMDINQNGTFDFEEIRIFFLNFCQNIISFKLLLIIYAKKLEMLNIDTMQSFINEGIEENKIFNIEEFLESIAPILGFTKNQASQLFLELIKNQDYYTVPLKVLVQVLNSYRYDIGGFNVIIFILQYCNILIKNVLAQQKQLDEIFYEINKNIIEMKNFLQANDLSVMELFDKFDNNSQHFVKLLDIKNDLCSIVPFMEKHICQWLSTIDINENGILDRREWDLIFLVDIHHQVSTPSLSIISIKDKYEIIDQFAEIFQIKDLTPQSLFYQIDTLNIGKITLLQFKKYLQQMRYLSLKKIIQIIKVFDLDTTGEICLDNFVQFFPNNFQIHYNYTQNYLSTICLEKEHKPQQNNDFRVDIRNKQLLSQQKEFFSNFEKEDELYQESQIQLALYKLQTVLKLQQHQCQTIINQQFENYLKQHKGNNNKKDWIMTREEFVLILDMFHTQMSLNEKVLLVELADNNRLNQINFFNFLFQVLNTDIQPEKNNKNQIYLQNFQAILENAKSFSKFEAASHHDLVITDNLLKLMQSRPQLSGIHSESMLYRILASCILKQQEFTDPYFPPIVQSICNDKNHKYYRIFEQETAWYRPHEVFKMHHLKDHYEQIQLFEDINPNDIRQSKYINNSNLMASLSVMAEFHHLIRSIFYNEKQNKFGVYGLKVFIKGIPNEIIVDDKIPCSSIINYSQLELDEYDRKSEYNQVIPISCRPLQKEIWVLLLEKCWAKLFGCYTQSGKIESNLILEYFLGFPCKIFNNNNSELFKNSYTLQKFLHHADKQKYLLTCSVSEYQILTENRLVVGRAYSILQTYKNISQEKYFVLKMRDPTGQIEYKGVFEIPCDQNNQIQQSKKSNIWSEQNKQQLNVVDFDEIEREGIFYMSHAEFIQNINEITVCYYKETFKYQFLQILPPPFPKFNEDIEVYLDSKFEGYLHLQIDSEQNVICFRLHQEHQIIAQNQYSYYRYSPCEFNLFELIQLNGQINQVNCKEIGSSQQYKGNYTIFLNDNNDPFIILKKGQYIIKYKIYNSYKYLNDFSKLKLSQQKFSKDNKLLLLDLIKTIYFPIVISSYAEQKIDLNYMEIQEGKFIMNSFYKQQAKAKAKIVDEVNGIKFACVEIHNKFIIYIENNNKKNWICFASVIFEGLNNLKISKKYMSSPTSIKFQVSVNQSEMALLHIIDKEKPFGIEKLSTEFHFQNQQEIQQ